MECSETMRLLYFESGGQGFESSPVHHISPQYQRFIDCLKCRIFEPQIRGSNREAPANLSIPFLSGSFSLFLQKGKGTVQAVQVVQNLPNSVTYPHSTDAHRCPNCPRDTFRSCPRCPRCPIVKRPGQCCDQKKISPISRPFFCRDTTGLQFAGFLSFDPPPPYRSRSAGWIQPATLRLSDSLAPVTVPASHARSIELLILS